MLEKENLDIVCIATHPELHEKEVVDAAEAGVKGIFCEKPMCISLAEADAMIEACNRAGAVLLINHSRRWDPAYHKARALIQEGAIGDLVTVVGYCQGAKPYPSWRADEEGPLLHDATHTLDLFRFFGGEVDWVLGTAVRRKQPFRVEDDSLSIIQFKSGVSGVAVVNELTEYAYGHVELQGTDGKIVMGSLGYSLWSSQRSPYMIHESDPNVDWRQLVPGPFPEVPRVSNVLEAAKDMINCMDTGKTPNGDGHDGRAALEIIMAIYESQRRGNVKVSLPLPGGPSSLHLMREEGMF
jgi:predicted dehydrogenase